LGGGTGTGSSSVIAKNCKEKDILTIGIFTYPFNFESSNKKEIAEKGLEDLSKICDSYIVLPNQYFSKDKSQEFISVLNHVNEYIREGMKEIHFLMVNRGLFNLDFSDLKRVFSNGRSIISIGYGKGPNRISDALSMLKSSPIFSDKTVKSANTVLINFSSGSDTKYTEIEHAFNDLKVIFKKETNIAFGLGIEDREKKEEDKDIKILIIASGLDQQVITRSFPDLFLGNIRNGIKSYTNKLTAHQYW